MRRVWVGLVLVGWLTGCGGGGAGTSVGTSGAVVSAPVAEVDAASPLLQATAPRLRMFALEFDGLRATQQGATVRFSARGARVLAYRNNTATSESIDLETLLGAWTEIFGNGVVTARFLEGTALYAMQRPVITRGGMTFEMSLRSGELVPLSATAVLLFDNAGGRLVTDPVPPAPTLVGQAAEYDPTPPTIGDAGAWRYVVAYEVRQAQESLMLVLTLDRDRVFQYRVRESDTDQTVEALDGGPLPVALAEDGTALPETRPTATTASFPLPSAARPRRLAFALDLSTSVHARASLQVEPSDTYPITPPIVDFPAAVTLQAVIGEPVTLPFVGAPAAILQALFPADSAAAGTEWGTQWRYTYEAPGQGPLPLLLARPAYTVGRDEATISTALTAQVTALLAPLTPGGTLHLEFQLVAPDGTTVLELQQVILSP